MTRPGPAGRIEAPAAAVAPFTDTHHHGEDMTHAMPPGQPFPPQWQQAAPPPPKRRRRIWPWALAAVLLLMLFVGILADAAGGNNDPATTGPASPPETQTWVVKPSAVPAQSGPKTTFSSGTHEVGTDIAPGKYKTTGPDDGGSSCYWARLKNTDGAFDSIKANGNTQGPTTVTISPTDAAFQTSGCTWTKAD